MVLSKRLGIYTVALGVCRHQLARDVDGLAADGRESCIMVEVHDLREARNIGGVAIGLSICARCIVQLGGGTFLASEVIDAAVQVARCEVIRALVNVGARWDGLPAAIELDGRRARREQRDNLRDGAC